MKVRSLIYLEQLTYWMLAGFVIQSIWTEKLEDSLRCRLVLGVMQLSYGFLSDHIHTCLALCIIGIELLLSCGVRIEPDKEV